LRKRRTAISFIWR